MRISRRYEQLKLGKRSFDTPDLLKAYYKVYKIDRATLSKSKITLSKMAFALISHLA